MSNPTVVLTFPRFDPANPSKGLGKAVASFSDLPDHAPILTDENWSATWLAVVIDGVTL